MECRKSHLPGRLHRLWAHSGWGGRKRFLRLALLVRSPRHWRSKPMFQMERPRRPLLLRQRWPLPPHRRKRNRKCNRLPRLHPLGLLLRLRRPMGYLPDGQARRR